MVSFTAGMRRLRPAAAKLRDAWIWRPNTRNPGGGKTKIAAPPRWRAPRGPLSRMPSDHRHAAIHMNGLAGDIGRLVAGEPGHRRGDLRGGSHALHRNRGH